MRLLSLYLVGLLSSINPIEAKLWTSKKEHEYLTSSVAHLEPFAGPGGGGGAPPPSAGGGGPPPSSGGGGPGGGGPPSSGGGGGTPPSSGGGGTPPSGGTPTSKTSCDACGGSATYTETLSTVSGQMQRKIVTNGCPNHYSYCTGKGIGVCAGIGSEGTGTEAVQSSTTYTIPAYPQIASSTTDLEYDLGALGVALNGVGLYGGAVGGGKIIDVSDSTAEWTSFDICSGHSGPAGDYHYHFPPSCLITQIENAVGTVDGHSAQLGWAKDGFPVYGPYGPGGLRMTHTSKGCTGTYCLDNCGGMAMELPSIDNFKYRYYTAGQVSDLDSLPTSPRPAVSDYPFILKCYVGCVWDDIADGSCSGTAGYTSSYTPSVTTGYTEKFTQGFSDRLCYSGSGSSTHSPTPLPTNKPVADPTSKPIGNPTVAPTRKPVAAPSPKPSAAPVFPPTRKPTPSPTFRPTTLKPTLKPTRNPTPKPSTRAPSRKPTRKPTL